MTLEQPNAIIESVEDKELMEKLMISLKDIETFEKVRDDFSKTFLRLGEKYEQRASYFSTSVLNRILTSKTLIEVEGKVKNFFEDEDNLIDNETIFSKIEKGLSERRELIFSQLEPYLKNIEGKVIDYGAGSGQITQMFHDRLGLDIEGVDVRNFKAKEVTIPMQLFDGYKVPVEDGHYSTAVLTNVIHHEKDNEKVLAELNRIVKNKLVIIETVPEGNTSEEIKKDWGRMLLNDTLWNRFFNYANIPVPGTYETPGNWIKRFEKYGWSCSHSLDLGFDQPTIQDRHHLLVFEKK